MSKSDLKAAMQSLQVNKPLRLAGRAPSFVAPAPTSPSPTPVENPTQVEKPTGVELHTQVRNTTEVEKPTVVVNPTQVAKPSPVESDTQVIKTTEVVNPTPVQIETQVTKPTEVVLDTLVVKPTQVANQTPVTNETPVSKTTEVVRLTETQPDQISAMRRATEQDSSVVLEARACEGLEKGYSKQWSVAIPIEKWSTKSGVTLPVGAIRDGGTIAALWNTQFSPDDMSRLWLLTEHVEANDA